MKRLGTLVILFIAFLLIGCQQRSRKHRFVEPRTFNLKELYILYGLPKDIGSYTITEQQDEFRTSVLNCFTDAQRRKRNITVKEYAWQLPSPDSLITVWYLPAEDSLRTLCYVKRSVYELY